MLPICVPLPRILILGELLRSSCETKRIICNVVICNLSFLMSEFAL